MILDDDHVALALAVLRDSERAYQVEHAATMTEVEADEIRARKYLETSGTVGERDAKVTIDVEVMGAMRRYAAAKAEVRRWQQDKSSSDQVIEVWRTENANTRAMERVR